MLPWEGRSNHCKETSSLEGNGWVEDEKGSITRFLWTLKLTLPLLDITVASGGVRPCVK